MFTQLKLLGCHGAKNARAIAEKNTEGLHGQMQMHVVVTARRSSHMNVCNFMMKT